MNKNQGGRNRVKFSNHQPREDLSNQKKWTGAHSETRSRVKFTRGVISIGRSYRESSQYRSSRREKEGKSEGEGRGGVGHGDR